VYRVSLRKMRQLCVRIALLGPLSWASSLVVGCSLLLGCGGSGDSRVSSISGLDAELTQGEPVYEANCKTCHGSDGKGAGGSIKRNVAQVADEAEEKAIRQILSGSDEMPSFANLSDQNIADVVRYLGSLN
jgi:cytochrome c551